MRSGQRGESTGRDACAHRPSERPEQHAASQQGPEQAESRDGEPNNGGWAVAVLTHGQAEGRPSHREEERPSWRGPDGGPGIRPPVGPARCTSGEVGPSEIGLGPIQDLGEGAGRCLARLVVGGDVFWPVHACVLQGDPLGCGVPAATNHRQNDPRCSHHDCGAQQHGEDPRQIGVPGVALDRPRRREVRHRIADHRQRIGTRRRTTEGRCALRPLDPAGRLLVRDAEHWRDPLRRAEQNRQPAGQGNGRGRQGRHCPQRKGRTGPATRGGGSRRGVGQALYDLAPRPPNIEKAQRSVSGP